MTGYTCKTCGTWHDERPTCFIAPLPEAVLQVPESERGRRVEAGPSQCILDGEHFFILGNLDIPIIGSAEPLRWSVWSTLSQPNFKRAAELWETPGREDEPAYFGWLSNHIPGYAATINIKVFVHTQEVGIRPQIEVLEEGHPLRRDQIEGISADRADELIHASWSPDSESPATAAPPQRPWWKVW